MCFSSVLYILNDFFKLEFIYFKALYISYLCHLISNFKNFCIIIYFQGIELFNVTDLNIPLHFSFSFFGCLGLNLKCHACQASIVPLRYIPSYLFSFCDRIPPTHSVIQAGLELRIFLSPPPQQLHNSLGHHTAFVIASSRQKEQVVSKIAKVAFSCGIVEAFYISQ